MEENKYMLLGHERWGDGGSWLGCQVLPAIGASSVSIFQELPIVETPGCLRQRTSAEQCSCLLSLLLIELLLLLFIIPL